MTIPDSLPAHLQAILTGKVRAVARAHVAPARDKAPVFEPSQSGGSPLRSIMRTIEECEEIEVHDMPIVDNADPEGFSITIPD